MGDFERDKDDLQAQAVENDANYEERVKRIRFNELIDSKYGFEKYTQPAEKNAWLVNIQPSEVIDEQTKAIVSAVDFYFIEDSGQKFKIAYTFRPYFYIATTEGAEYQVSSWLSKKYGGFLTVEHMDKEDLELKNHLSGLKRTYIKLTFPSTNELTKLKRELMPVIRKNKERIKKESQYCTYLARNMGGEKYIAESGDVLSEIVDMREHDLPYHMRVAIDQKYFVGKWYSVRGITNSRAPSIKSHPTLIDPVDPVVLAFDIETTKLPLKFPDSSTDQIMMISYMVDGSGFLIINREIVSMDVEGFEYTPKEEFKGEFTVWNEADEKALIRRFFDHIMEVQPSIIVTYNGDFFDWPFVENRAKLCGMDMMEEVGFAKDSSDEFKCRNCIHMDAFRWVKRDSYLPVGSQNLKAVAKAKLRYDPVEVDPEEMCKMAREEPQSLANYSVSDAVATYYLYMKYVHPFVFALCTIIPLGPDDVLRKGSGTLCEALLMVEAFHNNIVYPNKYTGLEEAKITKDGHRIESETYVGGHVEALEAGVFRADIPCRFRLNPAVLKELQDEVSDTLEKELLREFDIPLEKVVDFEERSAEVREAFENMLRIPHRMENPRIYHLDVGAMYPNIILTNRLQPSAMVDEEICMACTYNRPDAKCKRTMNWEWRGELTPATRGEYQQILQQLEGETFGKPPKAFHQLEKLERQAIEKKRIQDYSRRVYGKTHLTRVEKKEQMICQRENAFYVDTVKAFRDRRYDYKELLKKAKGALDEAPKDDISAIKSAHGRIVLYESLQLAHKCILNSFYGYVMRKGSRWFSMEMAGVVCHTGANIITKARKLVDHIGKPLELDTDGIWCLIPGSFPENVTFKLQNHKRKTVTVSYPGAMLNALVFKEFTNEQYHNLQPTGSYTVSSENSIFFEVDGPYQCMVLPASKEEGKKLKKRYAVFNLDGSLAELKGFEVKRRGELNIIKHFQSAVFKAFLRGSNLDEVYASVAREADYWLDVLFSKGIDLSDSELFDLISENRSMSRKLEDYGMQKSTSISTAKRLAEFLGESMVKDAGLACRFVISRHPIGSPVTERAVPVAIFQAEPVVAVKYLKQWTRQPITADNINIREILDWNYYVERLGSCIQKIITIPAALQGVSNPVPRINHPDWLDAKIKNRVDALKQPRITDLFQKAAKVTTTDVNEYGKRSLTPNGAADEGDECEKENTEPKRTKQTERPEEKLRKKTIVADGFDEWLVYMKQKWRTERKLRKQQKKNSSVVVDRCISQTRERNKDRCWQVLSIEESRIPGYFYVWAATDGQMNKVTLRVERIVAVNSREPKPGKETVRRALPHQKPSFFLYEYKTDEGEFQKLLAEANAELCSAQVEGVYESETPLWLRVYSQLGCLCRPTLPPVGGAYQIESMKMVPLNTGQISYLPNESVRTVFLYKYSQDTRHVWFFVDPSTRTGQLFVVNRGELQMPNVDKLYESLLAQRKNETECSVTGLREGIKFTVRQFVLAKDAEKEIGKALRLSREATARPTLLSLVSDDDQSVITARVANLSLFPIVRLHIREPAGLLNAIDWQRSVSKRVILHFFNSYIYLDDYAEWARYLHIPIGNVPSDPALLGLDLFFARHLHRNGHVLWASPSSRPDLGGKELDDVRLGVEWKPLSKDHSVLLNRQNFSGQVCVQLELGAVAVTALVQRGRLLQAEGADDTVAFDSTVALPSDAVFGLRNTISAYDEGAAVDSSLKMLKQLLSDCVRDIAEGNNKRADDVAMALSRWLHTSSALLFDPAITRSVSVLERKLVLLLCAECERLGAKVVHATATKMVLCTGKMVAEEGEAFTTMLIKSLGSNPLFAALTIRVSNLWDALLWHDGYNHTGIACQKPSDELSLYEDENGETHSNARLQVQTTNRWRMSEELDEKSREEFNKIVSGYVLIYIKNQMNKEMDESSTEFRGGVVEKHVGHRMFSVVSRMCEENRELEASALVRMTCLALGCDGDVDEWVSGLRENLQRILNGVKAPPLPATVFLANVFCRECSIASDVDIGDEEGIKCSLCQRAFSLELIDSTVSGRLNDLLTAYLLQDHQCTKCKSIRRDTLSKYCECSGEFANTTSEEDMRANAVAVCRVATARALPRSQEVSQWILSTTTTI